MTDLDDLTVGDLVDLLADRIAARISESDRNQTGETEARQPSDLLTVSEAADYLRAKPQRIYDVISQGRLPTERDGRRILIRREAIDRYLSQHKQERTR